jgi:hypothetical protein
LVVYVDLRRYQGLKMNLGQDTTLFAKVVSMFSVLLTCQVSNEIWDKFEALPLSKVKRDSIMATLRNLGVV